MTATDELRRMLDERGVEWGNIRNDGSESDYLTEWQFEDNQGEAIAIEWSVGSGLSVKTHRYHLTPEQAIAATLGSGTCRRVFYEPTGVYVCSECGLGLSKKLDRYCYLRYCPNCGRKIEVEE